MFTRTTVTAVRLLVYIGLAPGREPLSVRQIAEALDESPTYLGQGDPTFGQGRPPSSPFRSAGRRRAEPSPGNDHPSGGGGDMSRSDPGRLLPGDQIARQHMCVSRCLRRTASGNGGRAFSLDAGGFTRASWPMWQTAARGVLSDHSSCYRGRKGLPQAIRALASLHTREAAGAARPRVVER